MDWYFNEWKLELKEETDVAEWKFTKNCFLANIQSKSKWSMSEK